MKEKLKKIFEKYKILLNENQLLQFEKYYQFLVEENKKSILNVIRPALPDDAPEAG